MYLILHRRVWQARHTIPESLRPFFDGRPAFKKSTGETDKSRAEAVAAGYYAGWRTDLNRAKDALRANLSIEDFKQQRESALPMLADFVPISALSHMDAEQANRLKKTRRAIGGARLADHIDDWLAALVGNQPKTKHMKETDARAFAALFETAGDVTKADAQKWADGQIAAGVTVATVRRKLSNIRSLWHYLQSIDLIADEVTPLNGLRLPDVKATATKIRPFTAPELGALVANARAAGDHDLVDLIVIGAFTGARIEEIASLRAIHIDLPAADIILLGTKTENAPRRLPIHRDLKPTLARLVAGTGEPQDFLFKNLTANKFGDRSNAIGKRFGHLKTDHGFGRDKVFHSIRHAWRSQLHSAHVMPELADQMLGHETGRLGLDVYAPDPDRAVKAKAISKLKYPGLFGP